MSGVFRGAQSIANKVSGVVKKVDPIGYKINSKLDAGGNAIGVYGSDAPAPLWDGAGDATGMYGNDSAAARDATMNNARISALQQGDNDMDAVNRRTAASFDAENPTRKTLFGRLG
jgi:hypothetical protein